MPYKLPHPEAKPPKLNPARVPLSLRPAIPLAEKYGVADDGYRLQLSQSLEDSDLDLIRGFVQEHEDALDHWLAGPEAYGQSFSDEYIAFSALRMMADLI